MFNCSFLEWDISYNFNVLTGWHTMGTPSLKATGGIKLVRDPEKQMKTQVEYTLHLTCTIADLQKEEFLQVA